MIESHYTDLASTEFKAGDLVKPFLFSPGHPVLNDNIVCGRVVDVIDETYITIDVIEHLELKSGRYCVKKTEVQYIRDLKYFNREEVLQMRDQYGAWFLTTYSLRYADLSGLNLDGCDFSGRDLNYANFDESSLIKADFTKAFTRNTSFENACLIAAIFDEADIDNSDFTNADFTGASMRYAVLTNSEFPQAKMIGIDATKTDFKNSVFKNAKINGSNFSGASFKDVDLSTVDWENSGADFTGATNLPEWRTKSADELAKEAIAVADRAMATAKQMGKFMNIRNKLQQNLSARTAAQNAPEI